MDSQTLILLYEKTDFYLINWTEVFYHKIQTSNIDRLKNKKYENVMGESGGAIAR